MPAAELFGIWAVAQATAADMARGSTAVLSIGGCQPAAAAAVNAATSGGRCANCWPERAGSRR
eukprot:3262653-Pleurochrysis_carterae.AAC.1